MPNYNSLIQRGRSIIYKCLIVFFLLISQILPAQEAVYLKNRWTGEYIGGEASQLVLSPAIKKSLWYIERIDDDYVRLRNKSDQYLNVEKGYLEASKVPAGFFSAQWKLSVIDGHHQISNRWKDIQIHTQNRKLEASKAAPGWWSAQWILEDAEGNTLNPKNFSLNAYTHFTPESGKYYKLQQINSAKEITYMDVNPKRSDELVFLPEYSGDNGGKAWRFVPVADGWYKITNLKLGGNKVLAIAKNTNGSYYFVLTDFAMYPNQLWRMIQFPDPTLKKVVADYKLSPERLATPPYTLVSKQHGLEAIHSNADTFSNSRVIAYTFNKLSAPYGPFDLMVQPGPVNDLTAIRNIPLSEQEAREQANASIQQALKVSEEAMLKATPKAVSPYKPPSGHIKGETGLNPVASGRDFGALLKNPGTEYTQEEWDAAVNAAGKIPMEIHNNTNFEVQIMLDYFDENGLQVIKRYTPTPSRKKIFVLLSPDVTYLYITVLDPTNNFIVHQSKKFYRSKAMKYFLDGNKDKVWETIWDW